MLHVACRRLHVACRRLHVAARCRLLPAGRTEAPRPVPRRSSGWGVRRNAADKHRTSLCGSNGQTANGASTFTVAQTERAAAKASARIGAQQRAAHRASAVDRARSSAKGHGAMLQHAAPRSDARAMLLQHAMPPRCNVLCRVATRCSILQRAPAGRSAAAAREAQQWPVRLPPSVRRPH